MTVSNCTAPNSTYDPEADLLQKSPAGSLGLAGFPDSILAFPKAPKPNCMQRFCMGASLVLVHFFSITLQFINWSLKTFFGMESRQKVLYRELHLLSKKNSPAHVEEFLIENSTGPFAASYLFSEFLDLPEIHPFLPEILQGANICLDQDRGFFYRRWSDHPDSYKRPSSHQYQKDECYALGHFLFWLDPNGSTRFQFENSPFKGLLNSINHLMDYLRYRRDNEQQGVAGTSPYTEECCLKVQIDPLEFLTRKLN
ncbi:MAG: hypothetical protein ACD_17C00277G0001 [uncultured bacterium]|nr:MAG: hypothetical protein ACD_17C00277G0001 [uncultured bacterium]